MQTIYASIVEDAATNKVKPEAINWIRQGVKKYLMRRYTSRGADIIL